MSGIILPISIVLIVLLGIINPENDISVYYYIIFNYILYNILILPPKYKAFPYLDQSRREDKVTATEIKRGFDIHEDPPERVFVSGLMMLISIVLLRVTVVICYAKL